ncbi:MAG: S9 family peptidase [Thermomicrobiales bacterium]|nr:S9 family peptidase [Thermomicrobiales bacterium]
MTASNNRFLERAETYFKRRAFSEPVFIGDDLIACLDDASGTKQVSVIAVSTGEITPLTSFPDRMISLRGSKQSGRIVFGMDKDGDERQQLWAIDAVGSEPRRLNHADAAMHEPGPLSASGELVLYRSNAREFATFDVVALGTDGNEPEIWLEGAGQVTPAALHPDGNSALVIKLNGNMDADLLLVRPDGTFDNLTPHDSEQWILDADFDATGGGAYLTTNHEREFCALIHLDIASGERTVVFESAWDVETFSLSPDGMKAIVAVNENGATRLLLLDLKSGDRKNVAVPPGVADSFSWSPDGTSVAFGFSTAEAPSAIVLADLHGRCRVLASEHGKRPATVVPEAITYKTFDGRQIPAFFFRPAGDGPFPAVIEIHGGPEHQRHLDYNVRSGPAIQYLVSLGYAVLALNVRGSTGYGKAYCHLDDKGLRLDSVTDVVHAGQWLKERDDIIADKIAVFGASYGGFMTLAALAFHPEHWAAGIELVGIGNFVTFLERTSAWRRAHREAEYGSLADDREMLERISPVHQIDQITAPLLIFHGREDPRVPVYESEQMAEALKARGIDVGLTIFEDEGHSITKRKNILAAFAEMGDFLNRVLTSA